MDGVTETRSVIVVARELIAKPENWTQGARARAGKFCAEGALLVAARRTGHPDYRTIVKRVERANRIDNLCDFNDEHTHHEVLALFYAPELADA